MPYRVEMTLAGGLGVFREHPTKVYPDRDGGELLTADELAVWRYVQHLEARVAKLQEFKAYVHRRLDEAGVPVDPDSPHKAEGCRIGGRLDEVFRALEAAGVPPKPPKGKK